MFFISLGIGGERLEIRADHRGDAEDLHGNILAMHGQDVVGEQRVREPHDPHLRHPDHARQPVGQFVVGQLGDINLVRSGAALNTAERHSLNGASGAEMV